MNTTLLSLRSLFVSVGVVHLATAALSTLVSVRIAEAGGTQEAASFVAASYSFGFLLGCFFIFRPLASIGHIRAFAASASLCSLCALLLSATENTTVLILARFLTGLATASLYSIGDAWINDTAPPKSRGRVLSIYYIVLGVTSVASQAFIILFAGDLADAFVAMSALYSIAIVILVPTRTMPPTVSGRLKLRLVASLREAPTAFTGVFINGFIVALLLTVLPYQASANGMDADTISFGVAAFYLGRILFQFPIAAVSDTVDRRYVIAATSLCAATAILVLTLATRGQGATLAGDDGVILQWVTIICSVVLGGLIMPLYSVLIAHAMDRTVPVYVGPTAVTLLLVFTVGSIVGPIAGGIGSIFWEDRAILWMCWALMLVAGIIPLVRIKMREGVPHAEAAAGVAASPTSISISPEAKRPERAKVKDVLDKNVDAATVMD